MFSVGDTAYLSKEIIEPATSDHPVFLMGKKGEKVNIINKGDYGDYEYLVECKTNKGKYWYVSGRDLMRTKPMSCN